GPLESGFRPRARVRLPRHLRRGLRSRRRLRSPGVHMANTRPKFFDSSIFPALMKAMSVAHVALFRLTRGRVGSTYRFGSAFPRGIPACLLTTRGRKTGKHRTCALVYLPDGENVVLIASRVGTPVHPQWYLNLQADPQVIIETY